LLGNLYFKRNKKLATLDGKKERETKIEVKKTQQVNVVWKKT
jgi:hypothetical protein